MNTQRTHIDTEHAARQSEILLQRYRLEGLIGRGNMAEIYRAYDLSTGKYCAVKILMRNYALQDEVKRRFLREAEIIRSLNHPNIVKLHDLCITDDGTPILAMELLTGEDLSALLLRQGPLSLEDAVCIMSQVGSGVAALHRRGVLHRDIKPQNIFLCKTTGGPHRPVVKLIDLGLAKLLIPNQSHAASEQMLIGTPEYLAPEATTGRPDDVDERIDQWAMAVTLYRMLSGQLPFPLTTSVHELMQRIRTQPPVPLEAHAPGHPAELSAVIRKALQKDKSLRYPGVEQFVSALRSATDCEPVFDDPTVITYQSIPAEVPIAQPAPSEPPAKASHKRPLRRRAALAALITAPMLLILVAGALRARERPPQPASEMNATQQSQAPTSDPGEPLSPRWLALPSAEGHNPNQDTASPLPTAAVSRNKQEARRSKKRHVRVIKHSVQRWR